MKKLALTAALALAVGIALPASAIEVVNNHSPQAARVPDLAAVPQAVMLNNLELSELPEPEVLAMMLVGVVLIGYRASRDSNEKFK